MNTTESLEYGQASILYELTFTSHKKEVILQHLIKNNNSNNPSARQKNKHLPPAPYHLHLYLFTLTQFFLGKIKVKVHIEALDKLSYGVSVGIRFLEDKEGMTV